MLSGNTGCQSRFSPSKRILELAQHKVSKTVWATTPCEKINWGNQEPIWPLSASALGTVPTDRIQYLARPKRDFSAWDHPLRKELTSFSRKSFLRPSSKASCSEHIVRLSTPRGRQRRGRDSHDITAPHTPECEYNCPVWHVDPRVKSAKVIITKRLLQLSNPKSTHPDWSSGRENVEMFIDGASRDVRASPRLKQLSLPKLKESNVCYKLGRPEESILTVSRGAKKATASPRIERLATPKELSKDYIYPQDSEWNRRYCFSAPGTRTNPRKRPLTK